MKNPTILCAHCQNQLYDSGLVISSYIGPLLMCSNCRGLYYIDLIMIMPGQYSLSIKTAEFTPDEEYKLIRDSVNPILLADFIKSMKEIGNSLPPPIKPLPSNVNTDIKHIIETSVTPSDLIKKLNA